MTPLIFQSSPTVTIATNKFSNVPTILQFDYTPLISVVKEDKLGFTPEVPIHHSDGTYLGKVRGNRFFPTEDGKKAGVNVRQLPDMTVCEMGSNTLFEIRHQTGNAFRMDAEIYAPTGHFIKCANEDALGLLSSSGQELKIGGVVMTDCSFSGCRIGIWMTSGGDVSIGVS